MILCPFKGARALNTSRIASQFVQERWTAQNGLAGAHVRAITQTPDGYLWIATDGGLMRFDGFSFRSISFGLPTEASNSSILGLTTDKEGDLLVRLQGWVVLLHSNGEFERLPSDQGATTSSVTAMWRDKSGEVLLWDILSGLLRFRDGRLEVVARPQGLGGPVVISMTQTPDGKIWFGSLGAGLLTASPGVIRTENGHIPGTKVSCLLPMAGNQLLVGTDEGLFRWNGASLSKVSLPAPFVGAQVLTLLRDRSDKVWVGTTQGLARINADGSALSDESDVEREAVNALFEDREGNIWAGGPDGLERIRESTFVTYPTAADDRSKQEGPIFVDTQNRGWFAPSAGRLLLLNSGRPKEIKSSIIPNDVIYSITGHKDDIWIGTQHEGLTHFKYNDNRIVDVKTYTRANGLAENSVYAIYLAPDETVWAGTLTSGVSELKNQRFVTYTIANGLASNTISSILQTRDGSMWFGTPNGLSALSGGRWTTYTTKEGLPSNDITCLFQGSSGILWIGTSAGLASMESGDVRAFVGAPAFLRQPTLGLAEDQKGALWIATSSHVLRVSRDKLFNRSLSAEDIREYGIDDGLLSTEGVKRNGSVVFSPDGRIWFSLKRGVSVVDPSRLSDNSAPALAHIESISADNTVVNPSGAVRIPPFCKRITFSYTGISLAEPGRVRFRYYLGSFDHGWSEPVAAREAAYTNLAPGNYRFHLMASNSDGLWNGSETSVAFQVEPAVWQTWWFRSLCVLAVVLGIALLYLIRMQEVTRQLNLRFEERLAERTRIARDLHDTLLQGVHGLTLRFHYAMQDLPLTNKTRNSLEKALEVADGVLVDARNQVTRLRGEFFDSNDLPKSFEKVGSDLNRENHIDFSIAVKGSVCAIEPLIGEELFFIGKEAITNAFLHAQPSEVKVEIDYGRHSLRLSCSDNGIGINPTYLQGGTPGGHWGLLGMRERSDKIGGGFTVQSELHVGTEIVLTVPARLAYERRIGFLGAIADRIHRRSS